MKKNLIHYLTLFLCAVLLPLTIIQSSRLEKYRVQLDNEFDRMKVELSNTINDIASDLRYELEDSAQPVDNYELTLGDIDYERRTIQINAAVTLKQWSEDSTVALIISDDDLRKTIYMTTDGTGTFATQLTVPLDDVQGFLVEAMVTTGGVSSKMDLGGYPDVYALLPLRNTGAGWTNPEYARGILKVDFEYYMEWQYNQPGTISNACFDIYVNDALTQTIPAHEQNGFTFSTSALEVECGENDVVLLVFRCEDSLGLGYIFPCTEFILENGRVTDTISMDSPQFYWITDAENCDH